MKALSIRQPWAWLVVQGIQDIINWKEFTGYRGPLLIHASKTWDEQGEKWIWNKIYSQRSLPLRTIPHRDDPRIRYGALIGRADLVDCIRKPLSRKLASPWFSGPYGFVLRNVVEFEVPVPYRGQLDLFEIPDYSEKRFSQEQL